MAWVVLEGLDRTGKTTIAAQFEKKGYEIVHFSAPSRDYLDPLYVGATYFEEVIETLSKYVNKDVVFDRSWYGELVWPQIYSREPLLDREDIEYIREIEKTEKELLDPYGLQELMLEQEN